MRFFLRKIVKFILQLMNNVLSLHNETELLTLHSNIEVGEQDYKPMNNKIKHTGIVDSVEEGCVKVRILQSSACSGCKVAAHCNASETKEKLVEVMVAGMPTYKKGDAVTVIADASVGFRASLYGYLLPLLVMVVTLVVVLSISHSEGMAALSALGILIPYYLILYLFRNRLKKRLQFALG